MKKLLLNKTLILFVLLYPILSFGQLSIGVAVVSHEDDVVFKKNAQLRQALIEANGKDWFIDNVIMNENDSVCFYLKFFRGNYLAIAETTSCAILQGQISINSKERGFLYGVKRAIDYLAEKKDTIWFYHTVFPPLPLDAKIIEFNTFKHAKWVTDSLNFDNMDYSVRREYVRISYSRCLNSIRYSGKTLCNSFSIPFPENLTKYLISVDMDTEVKGEFLPIQNKKDAEDMFILIKQIDSQILSLPSPSSQATKLLPWGYVPNQHNKDE